MHCWPIIAVHNSMSNCNIGTKQHVHVKVEVYNAELKAKISRSISL
jgi:hypothetical protein